MVQTREQTRKGAPPPSTIEPFSAGIQNNALHNPPKKRGLTHRHSQSEDNPPAPPDEDKQEGDEQGGDEQEEDGKEDFAGLDDDGGVPGLPPAPNVARTLEGVVQAVPHVLRDTVSYITGLDVHHLILATPAFRPVLRGLNAPRPLECQDSPVVPMLKHQDPTNFNLLIFQQVQLSQPTPCTTPAAYTVPLKRCEGYVLGYTGQNNALDHGPNFLVCQHCVQKAWEAYSMFVKSRGVDLCNRCSQFYRRSNESPHCPPNYWPQCTCLWDDKIWLCRTCRMAKSSGERDYALNWIQMHQNFAAMHAAAGQGTHPRHYVDSESRNGESYCPCGFNVQGKIGTYNNVLNQNAAPNFRPLVRLCIYCQKERFLTDSRLD